ncbi:BMP family ABC transporter substrate-binding protein [Brevibacterium sp.]|uniref:BMP family ABC transporter substrate-binding protein n=1 Tax=Brevibacterium sp. TaxID=1701 RepID=UPI002810AD7D|nr:BMP family ABC transporter substrate-binding protein [Brevibacterium sp.]
MRATGLRATLTAGFGVLSLLTLVGCTVATPEAVEEPTIGCMISAPAGFDDHSAGALTLAETQRARAAGIFSSTSSQRVSDGSATSAALKRMSDQGCALTTVIGPGGADELREHAVDHPDQVFLGIASGRDDFPDNVLSMDFDLVPAAFIAGYTAATASETGKVAALVSRGFPQGEDILDAFDAGVDLHNKEKDDEDAPDVKSYRESRIGGRTVDDTDRGGRRFFDTAVDADADVVVPFGSAASMGVITAATESHLNASTAEPCGDDDSEEVLPKVIWYGASGAFSDAIIATIEPNIRRGLRTIFPQWPQSRNPDEVAERSDTKPEDVGGFLVADRRYEGTISNGGVVITAEDGFLSRVSDAGRNISDLRERIKSGDIDPQKS